MGNGITGPAGSSIAALLAVANRRGASDLHVSAGQPPLLRVDGEIEALDEGAARFGLDSQCAGGSRARSGRGRGGGAGLLLRVAERRALSRQRLSAPPRAWRGVSRAAARSVGHGGAGDGRGLSPHRRCVTWPGAGHGRHGGRARAPRWRRSWITSTPRGGSTSSPSKTLSSSSIRRAAVSSPSGRLAATRRVSRTPCGRRCGKIRTSF